MFKEARLKKRFCVSAIEQLTIMSNDLMITSMSYAQFVHPVLGSENSKQVNSKLNCPSL